MPPKSVTIRTYNVGFGDCFLLSFDYGGGSEKHVLIDFGSTGLPEDSPKTRMMDIAEDIRKRSNGKLAAVVATHRHKDHISGFETKTGGKGTGNVIRSLAPDIVVQPWTEDPDLDTSATGPRPRSGASSRKKAVARKLRKMGDATPAYIAALSHMHAVARQLRDARNLPRAVSRELSFLGETNLANLSAVRNLMTMARNSYVYCGSKPALARILPGVKVHVLGPPTVAQTDTIKKQRTSDPEQFWQLHARSLASDEAAGNASRILFPRHVIGRNGRFPVYARWLRYHARMTRGEQLLQIVRILDQQMNNTSVILIFQVGNKRLLFPGDAQIENWQYALGQKRYQAALRNVNLYKVGHHGSRNATPMDLWKQFKHKAEKKNPARLKSLMSTMEGKHGHARSRTEVPRTTLVDALERETDLLTTQKLRGQKFFEDTTIRF